MKSDIDLLTEAYQSIDKDYRKKIRCPECGKNFTVRRGTQRYPSHTDTKGESCKGAGWTIKKNNLTEAYNKVHPSPFNEVTVTIPWEYIDDSKNIYEYGEAEVMVHIGDPASPDRMMRAYAYVKDVKGMPRKWLGKPSRNALFVNLSNQFIQDHKAEIDEAVSDSLVDEDNAVTPPSQDNGSAHGQPIGGKL